MKHHIKTILTIYSKISLNSLPLFLIKLYKTLISPLLGYNCRYYPSCSDYAYTSYEKYGIITGTILSITRIIRCNPFGNFGFDPVPDECKKIFF